MGKIRPLAEQDSLVAKPLPPAVEPLSGVGLLMEHAIEPAEVLVNIEVERAGPLSRLIMCCSPPADEFPSLKVSTRELLPTEQIQRWEQTKSKAVEYVDRGKPEKVEKLLANVKASYEDEKEPVEPLTRKAAAVFKAATLQYLKSQVEAAFVVSNLKFAGLLRK